MSQNYPAYVFRLPNGFFIRSYRQRSLNGSALHMVETKDVYEASHFRMGSDKTEIKEIQRAYPFAQRVNIQISRTITIGEVQQ